MISVEEAKKLIHANVIELKAVELNLQQASGYVLSQDIYAKYDIPAFRQSSMDGYALKFKDQLNELIQVGEMAAGSSSHATINDGEAYRIFTGAPLPHGADTVIMQEKVIVSNGKIIVADNNLQLGLNTREKGAEIRAGELAMQKGNLLTPGAIGFLAGIGVCKVNVFSKPKIAIILTGNELQKPGLPLNYGQIYESNSFALTAAFQQVRIFNIEVWEARDELEVLIKTLNAALQKNDIVLLTGGVSVGDYDFVTQAANLCGVKEVFHKVKQKPGKPLFFGKKQNQIIFGLPGNPSSVLSCFYNYVLLAIAILTKAEYKIQYAEAKLETAYHKSAGLTHFLKGKYANGKVQLLGAQESFRLSSFAQANCLICMEEEKTVFKIGDKVSVLLLPS